MSKKKIKPIDIKKMNEKSEEFDKEMRKVRREYRRKAAASIESAKKIYLTD